MPGSLREIKDAVSALSHEQLSEFRACTNGSRPRSGTGKSNGTQTTDAWTPSRTQPLPTIRRDWFRLVPGTEGTEGESGGTGRRVEPRRDQFSGSAVSRTASRNFTKLSDRFRIGFMNLATARAASTFRSPASK